MNLCSSWDQVTIVDDWVTIIVHDGHPKNDRVGFMDDWVALIND